MTRLSCTPQALRRRSSAWPGAVAWVAAAGVCAVAHAASAPPVAGANGMVVTAQHLATRVGVDVLKGGGNAIDAAVAVGYALAVVFPAAGNLGGGGFMTIQLADGRKTFLDFRETAPLAARADMYLGPDGNAVRALSIQGHLAVAVPGTVAGLEMARQRYGTKTRAVLIEPAIRLAREGFVLQQGDVDVLGEATEDLRRDPVAAAIYLDHGEPYATGRRLVQADLARTLARIRDQGARGFYQGPVGAAIVASSRTGGGILTQADLDRYEARERAPVECDYRGYHVVSAPPPSSGGVIVCEILSVLEGYPLKDLGWRSAQAVHDQIEAMRRAYADRNLFLGDPDFVDNPLQRLLDKDYASRVRAAIDPSKAGASEAIRPGAPPGEGTNTTHYSIVDRFGNAVSVTYTLNRMFGARVAAAGTGVLMNDEMDDFAALPGAANQFDLVQGAPNAIAPGKRPLSSMSPTIVSRDGRPVLVLGTPGGSRIPSVVALVILNVIDYGMDVQEAVDAPRFHQQWRPESTTLERYAIGPDARDILLGMGHRFVDLGPPCRIGCQVAAILVGAPSLGGAPVGQARFYGASDPRRLGGLALGY
jgi:gamma-glutamyltranspeptidase / glutathione hydrolase